MKIAGLYEFLRQVKLLAPVPDDELHALVERLEVVVYQLGDVVLRRGDPGDAFYIVYSGKARVVDDANAARPITLAVLGPGDTFGEQALVNRAPRGATVRASSTLTLLRLSAADFDALTAAHPALLEAFRERIRADTEFNFLRRLHFLPHLTPAETATLMAALDRVPLAAGEFLFREGEEGDSCYLIREGRLDIYKGSGQGRVKLASLGPGALVGEMSLLYGQPRSADAVAAEPTMLLGFRREVFERYLGKEGVRDLIARQAADRLLQNENLLDAADAADAAAPPAYALDWQPLKKGIFAPHYPVVRTTEAGASGAACLMMLDLRNRRPAFTPEEFAEMAAKPLPEGLLSLAWHAEERGYLTRLLRIDKETLREVSLPGIVRLGEEFAVIYAASEESVVIASPSRGLERIRLNELAGWDGRLLTAALIPDFGAAGRKLRGLFRQFAPLVRQYKGWLLALVVISLLVQLFGLIGPLMSKTIVDEVLVSADRSLLMLLLTGILVATGFQMAASALREYLVAYLTRQVGAALHLRFFQHILGLKQAAASRWCTGDYLVRFAENDKILRIVSESGFKIVIDSVMVAVCAALLIGMNGKLGGVAAGFIGAAALLMLCSSPSLRARERHIFDQRQGSESHIVEAVSGIQTIKSLAAEPQMFQRGISQLHATKVAEFRFANFSFNLGLASNAINQAGAITILGFGAALCLKGEMTTGDLVAFQALFGSALAPLLSLVRMWDEMQELRVSLERTGEVLSAELEDSPPDAAAPVIEGRVEFRNVTFRYPGSRSDAVRDFSLEVLPGQKVALVGRSGSGKTTVANLLLNLYQPEEGEIRIDNVELNRLDRNAYRRQLGVVEQSPHLFSGTIRENIAIANPGASFDEVVAAATLAGAHSFIEELPMGYDTQIGERGISLSGGQRQRVAIARAVLGNPRMLILDEATAALDTESESIIQRNLDRLMAGRTTFIIAHRLSTVRNADLIVVMDQGRIVEKGTHSELMEARGLYYYLHTRTG